MNKEWLNTSEYPFSSKFFLINGHNLHYIDEGKGDIIVFLHGTPSWSFDFRNVIKQLRSKYRCIAIDHIGFGLSDKPELYDYSTENHSKTFERFVQEKGLNELNLVMHDFGGPIGMNFAIRHPKMVKSLIILNSWLWSSEKHPNFIKFRKVFKNPLFPFLYRYFNFSAAFIMPSSFGEHKLSKQLLTQYTRPFSSWRYRNGTLAFARSLLYDQDWFQRLWDERYYISSKPTLFIWGMKDPILKPDYLKKFQNGFSNFKTVRLEHSGHFPQEEEPKEVADQINQFLNDNRKSIKGVSCLIV